MSEASDIRRRDEEGDFHQLDPAIVWEPERAWDEGCRDRECRCHTQALIGQRRD